MNPYDQYRPGQLVGDPLQQGGVGQYPGEGHDHLHEPGGRHEFRSYTPIVSGAFGGAMIGSSLGPVGSAVGGVIGGICGYNAGKKMY